MRTPSIKNNPDIIDISILLDTNISPLNVVYF